MFGPWLVYLGRKNVAISLARENLPGLVSNLTLSAINKFDRKISEKGAARAVKGFTLFILNEDMNDFIKTVKSLEDSGVLIDEVIETVKHKNKKTIRQVSWSFVGTFSCFVSTTSNFFSGKRH